MEAMVPFVTDVINILPMVTDVLPMATEVSSMVANVSQGIQHCKPTKKWKN
jgi:hypothetical protein